MRRAPVAGPETGEPYIWDQLLLDSTGLLPDVGGAIVMASAALEVFIRWALDVLHQDHELPTGLWHWINSRGGDHTKEPSVSEKFDTLLRVFTGRSLKDEPQLWQAHGLLRRARNTLVHEGVAMIGNVAVDARRARELIIGAEKIIRWVELLLPEMRRRVRMEAVGPFSRRLATQDEASNLDSTGINLRSDEHNQGQIRLRRVVDEQASLTPEPNTQPEESSGIELAVAPRTGTRGSIVNDAYITEISAEPSAPTKDEAPAPDE